MHLTANYIYRVDSLLRHRSTRTLPLVPSKSCVDRDCTYTANNNTHADLSRSVSSEQCQQRLPVEGLLQLDFQQRSHLSLPIRREPTNPTLGCFSTWSNLLLDRLYVTNLPSSKIQKEDLRTALYLLFSTHGPVLDVVALKTMKMRGQAHIVYRDIQTATQAMRSLDGFEIFGHKMVGLLSRYSAAGSF